ncbi:hypothetical protein RchiOBHm_Chr7g0181491 [Rosa chinensis]|uniref:Uncharacterized protein n=1 Tax=Rosa chinensis TaxID=74649 RepID=A0A2P6P2M2_ROSCH|nr:hypothetical protein RchiOBHm_Chr7g0181491 [Rosa chinensis]
MLNLTTSESEAFDNLFMELFYFWVFVFFHGIGFGLVGFPKLMLMGFWVLAELEKSVGSLFFFYSTNHSSGVLSCVVLVSGISKTDVDGFLGFG